MSLYALGDLHLSFQSDKSMDIFGSVWKRHERKIEKYVNRIVKPDDTLVLTGDHSWGRKLPECREDLAFIERLPGRKILLRGNHDMFWDAKKTERLNEEYNCSSCRITSQYTRIMHWLGRKDLPLKVLSILTVGEILPAGMKRKKSRLRSW